MFINPNMLCFLRKCFHNPILTIDFFNYFSSQNFATLKCHFQPYITTVQMGVNRYGATNDTCVDTSSSTSHPSITNEDTFFVTGESCCYNEEKQLRCVSVLEKSLEKRNLS